MDLYSFHLFAGAGGGILGDILLGHTPVGAVEIEEYPRKVLLQRQLDGILPVFPTWDDVTTFRIDNPETRPFIERLQAVRDRLVIAGGFPCQDISAAGKGAGIDGERSGLWSEMGRIIGEIRPRFAFVENSPVLTSRGLGTVLGDLAALGYDARWGVIGAHHTGAPHRRDRIWIVANSGLHGCASSKIAGSIDAGSNCCQTGKKPTCKPSGLCSAEIHEDVADTESEGTRDECQNERAGRDKINSSHNAGCFSGRDDQPEVWPDVANAEEPGLEGPESAGNPRAGGCPAEHGPGRRQAGWWEFEPDVDRVVDGLAFRVDRLKAIGNGQVPAVVELAWRILAGGLEMSMPNKELNRS